MFDFLKPTYVIATYNNRAEDYAFLCTFNDHFVPLPNTDKFYFKFTAKLAMKDYVKRMSRFDLPSFYFEVVDYRDLGYTYVEAEDLGKYTFG